MSKKISKLLLFSIALLLFSAQSGMTDRNVRSPSTDRTVTAGPYYNASTKSYFELFSFPEITWQEAELEAKNHIFKKTTGRLATINSYKTHKFLVDNFTFTQDTWVGLQFFCESSEAKWLDGTTPLSNHFENWEPNLSASNDLCVLEEFLPIFIRNNSFIWEVSSLRKVSNFYLVEYRTGTK